MGIAISTELSVENVTSRHVDVSVNEKNHHGRLFTRQNVFYCLCVYLEPIDLSMPYHTRPRRYLSLAHDLYGDCFDYARVKP